MIEKSRKRWNRSPAALQCSHRDRYLRCDGGFAAVLNGALLEAVVTLIG
jgi:hypothetical protein